MPSYTDDLHNAWPVAELDLHGLSQAQAEQRVMNFVMSAAQQHGGKVVRIVTGKGLHSPGRPVLLALVQAMLTGTLKSYVAAFAPDMGGGAVRVRMR